MLRTWSEKSRSERGERVVLMKYLELGVVMIGITLLVVALVLVGFENVVGGEEDVDKTPLLHWSSLLASRGHRQRLRLLLLVQPVQ